MATSRWMLGKSFDTHAPFEPRLTTADEILAPQQPRHEAAGLFERRRQVEIDKLGAFEAVCSSEE